VSRLTPAATIKRQFWDSLNSPSLPRTIPRCARSRL